MRVLVASHAHPALSKGGAEIAAHHLFRAVGAQPGHRAWFLGCDRDAARARLGVPVSQPFPGDEFLYAANAFDGFHFANRDPAFPGALTAILDEIQPDIVHAHHYLNFGVEFFALIRRHCPQAGIVLTLHEYLAICHHYGQMITHPDRTLCHEASPARCNACFPDRTPADFFLRQRYIARFFDLVDQFIAPSAFLAERYRCWGIARDRITVIENLLPASSSAAVARPAGDPLRIGFFGQISWLKGMDLLLDAAALLEPENLPVVFDLHGCPRGGGAQAEVAFRQRLSAAGRNVAYHGSYENGAVAALMAGVDAVVMPSIWWENAPVVIEEALRSRRPVLCADIGGMAEKVRNGLDGLHFRAGSAASLAGVVRSLAANPGWLRQFAGTMRAPTSAEAVTAAHLGLYRRIKERRAEPPPAAG